MAYSVKNVSDSELFNYYLTININNICRLCLEKSGILLPIFDPIKPPHFSILIMACASVQVVEGDGMPTYICQKCISKLNVAFQFKSQCESSDAKLRQHFDNLSFLSTKTDLISCIEIKKGNEPIYTLTSEQNHIIEESIIDHVTGHTIQTSGLSSPIQQPILREVPTKPIDLVQEFNPNFVNLKNVNTDSIKHIDLLDIRTTVGKVTITPGLSVNSIHATSDNVAMSATILQDHENVVHFEDKGTTVKQHQCDFCGKIFRTKPSLVHHIRIHTGERPFVCHLCDKRFINGGHLHTHMRTHTGEKNHTCPLCPKAFATAQQLTKHTIAIHTTERPYACAHCPKRFASSSNLATHIKIHTGEKNYRCDKCAKAFATKGQLFQHMLVHTGEKSFLCEYCHKRFSQKAHLVRHFPIFYLNCRSRSFLHFRH